MSISNKDQLASIRQTLLEAKFGDLLFWEKPTIERTIGPFNPSVFDHFENVRNNLVSQSERTLLSFSPEEVFLLTDVNLDDPQGKRTSWRGFLRDEIKKLQKQKPSWIAGGFGHPEYQADFDYWGKMEQFECHEALILSVGIEPKLFDENRLTDIVKRSKWETQIEPVDYLVKRREQFVRKFPVSDYGSLRVGPDFLFNWFTEIALDVHPSFLDALRFRVNRNAPTSNATALTVKQKTDRREIDKIAQLFTAMAIDHLGYDPKALRSPAPKEIANLAAEMGLRITDETVRKYLKLGAKFIAEDWEPK